MAGFNLIRQLYIEVDAETDGAVSGLIDVERHANRTEGQLESLGSAHARTGRRAAALTGAFEGLAMATGAVAVALGYAASEGGRVDETLAEVQAVTGATADQMENIRQMSAQLGADLPVTMLDSANAFREMTYAGFSAAEAINAARGATYLAVTGGLSMADAARSTTSALNAFRMESEQADSVANTLASTFANSAVTIDEISHSLEYAASAASQAGQSITDTSAAIGVLGDVGLRASKAGTGLQQIFARLAAPTAEAQEKMAELGLATEDFIDQEGNFLPLVEIMEKFSAALEGMGQAEQLQYLTEIFQARGGRAVMPLVNNVDRLNDKLSKVSRANIEGAIEKFQDLDAAMLEARNNEIEQMLNEMGSNQDLVITPHLQRRQLLRQFQQLSEDLDESELTQVISTSLEVDNRTAQILAGDIEAGASMEDLERGLLSATTAMDLAYAKMDTVAGQVEYLRGSVSSFLYMMYRGFRGPLRGVLDILIEAIDILNANTAVAKSFGIAMAGLLAVLSAATVAVGALALELTATYAAQLAVSQQTYAMTGAMWAYNAATRATSAATFLMTASFSQLAAAAGITSGSITTLASTLFTYSGLSGLVASASAAISAGLSSVATAAWSVLAALGPVGWTVLAVSAAFVAWKSGLLDMIGLGDEAAAVADYLGSALGGLARVLGFVLGRFAYLAGFGIGAVFGGLRDVVLGVVGVFSDMVQWFGTLNRTGKIVMGMLMPMVGLFWAIQTAADEAGTAWNNLRAQGLRLYGVLQTVFGDQWTEFIGGVQNAIHELSRALRFVTAETTDLLEFLDKRIGEAATAIRKFFELLENPDVSALEALSVVTPFDIETLRDPYGALKEYIQGEVEESGPVVAGYEILMDVAFLGPFSQDLRNWLQNQIEDAFPGLRGFIGDAWDDLNEPLPMDMPLLVKPFFSGPLSRRVYNWLDDEWEDFAAAETPTQALNILLDLAVSGPISSAVMEEIHSKVPDGPITLDMIEASIGLFVSAALSGPLSQGIVNWLDGVMSDDSPTMETGLKILAAPFLGGPLTQGVLQWLHEQVPDGPLTTETAVEIISNIAFAGPLTTDVNAWFQSQFEGIQSYVDGLIDDFWDWLGETFPRASDALANRADQLAESFQPIFDTYDQVMERLDNLGGGGGTINLLPTIALPAVLAGELLPKLEGFLDSLGVLDDIHRFLDRMGAELDEDIQTVLSPFAGFGARIDRVAQEMDEDVQKLLSPFNWLENQLANFEPPNISIGDLIPALAPGARVAVSLSDLIDIQIGDVGAWFGDGLEGALNAAITGIDVSLAALIDPVNYRDDARRWARGVVDGFWNWLQEGLNLIDIDLSESGRKLVRTFANGIRNSPQVLTTAVRNLLASVLPFLPSSDAEVGPLSSLSSHGEAIVRTLADGVLGSKNILATAIADLGQMVKDRLAGFDFKFPDIQMPDVPDVDIPGTGGGPVLGGGDGGDGGGGGGDDLVANVTDTISTLPDAVNSAIDKPPKPDAPPKPDKPPKPDRPPEPGVSLPEVDLPDLNPLDGGGGGGGGGGDGGGNGGGLLSGVSLPDINNPTPTPTPGGNNGGGGGGDGPTVNVNQTVNNDITAPDPEEAGRQVNENTPNGNDVAKKVENILKGGRANHGIW